MSDYSDQELDIQQLAQERYASGQDDADTRRDKYERLHEWYAPADGDQWPQDIINREGKTHITANIIRRFVDTEARLLSIMPRVTIRAMQDPALGRRAEATEKLFLRWLEQSGFHSWHYTLEQTKALYGIGIVKAFWNTQTNAPDAIVVEQPHNIMFGWGDSEYMSLDWTIYHYKISKLQARLRYPDCPEAYISSPFDLRKLSTQYGKTHNDPLNQLPVMSNSRIETEYERNQVSIWDYWYLDEKGNVYNAILLNGNIVEGPTLHAELPALPYIVIEHDHEPGSPDGRGTAELLIDLQDGINRTMSHYAQYVEDNSDPAYQLTGETAPMTVPDGLVPRAGEIIAPGPGTRVEQIGQGVNNFPFDSLIGAFWNTAHRITGLSEVLFGVPSSAQASGRAIAIQLESSINALDPKRQRSYLGIQTLLMMWHHMAIKVNPVLAKGNKELGTPTLKARDVIKGINDWQIIAPEITPRDVSEHTQNTVNKLMAKLVSLETAMNELGVENPLEEMERVRAERTDATLFPGDAQATAAVMALLQQLGQQQGMDPNASAQAQNRAQADTQRMDPTLAEDQNAPRTLPGSAPPGDASAVGGELRPIVRQNPEGESMPMSEMRLPNVPF